MFDLSSLNSPVTHIGFLECQEEDQGWRIGDGGSGIEDYDHYYIDTFINKNKTNTESGIHCVHRTYSNKPIVIETP